MKRTTLVTVLAICLGSPAHAALIDLDAGQPAATRAQVGNLAVTGRQDIVAPPSHMSELPEPEVFLMMLVGLVLIGYRASRDSSEKFK